MMKIEDYLKDCIYFEIHDSEFEIMNYYMFIRNKWIRGDDEKVFSPDELVLFMNNLISSRKDFVDFKFYSRTVTRVKGNG